MNRKEALVGKLYIGQDKQLYEYVEDFSYLSGMFKRVGSPGYTLKNYERLEPYEPSLNTDASVLLYRERRI